MTTPADPVDAVASSDPAADPAPENVESSLRLRLVRMWRTGLERWWQRMRIHATPEDRRRVVGIVFPSTATDAWRSKFIVMQSAAVVIATMGLLADSPAVVIGAMLVAPLMQPVLAVAAAVVLGWWRRLGTALVTLLGATLASMALAALLARLVPAVALTNEVLARTSPDARDLLVALAAGIAGAYATIREDVSGAMSGVAVAVALVPPLASAGIAFEAGRNDLAAGALLLYSTNLVAIAASGAVVFLVAGLLPAPHLNLSFRSLMVAVTVGILAVALIAVPLFRATVAAAAEARTTARVNLEVARWIEGLDLEIDEIRVDPDTLEDGVVVELSGSSQPPEPILLEDALGAAFGAVVQVRVRWTQTAQGTPVVAEPFDGLIDPDVVATAIGEWLTGLDLEATQVSVAPGDGGLRLEVTIRGPVAPPPASELVGLLSSATGADVDVAVGWVQTVRFTPDAETADSDIDVAQDLATTWAVRLDLVVVEVGFDRDDGDRTLTVVVAGEAAPPDAADLLEAVLAAFGTDTTLEVAWVRRVAVPLTATSTTTSTTTTAAPRREPEAPTRGPGG